ncbi:hypothetical protein GNI_157240 [Gregarina niphandrodes]|uniref:SNARE domain protein n=1 Tax=Gregarina niphandrodes TaxID=110365 RepID=A0A023AYU6_GRENI|nr:hypothetical protein GNI_157240 [Gregarina niphandrodes]EZG43842.1 hypothetical protein GNI_157240 [Gregarina niphandrodes]|eukprot:XP_011132963.1 hypothetical protein GNI_157240 [Gregarina niphandrodes]
MSFLNSELNQRVPGQAVNSAGQQQQLLLVEENEVAENDCSRLVQESIRVAAQTNSLAQTTVEELKSQTDQIHRIHRDAARTSDNLATTEYLIEGMSSWWSALKQVFVPPPKATDHKIGRNAPKLMEGAGAVPRQAAALPAKDGKSSVDSNIGELANILDEMKSRAIEANRELTYQNGELVEVQDVMESNESKIARQRRDLDFL